MVLTKHEFDGRSAGCAVLIFGPLCTGAQMVREAAAMGIAVPVEVVRTMPRRFGAAGTIYIANYEIADKFDLSRFVAVILDESSILKHKECKTGQARCI